MNSLAEKIVSIFLAIILCAIFLTLIYGHYPGRDVLDGKYYTIYQEEFAKILMEKGYSEEDAERIAIQETKIELGGTGIGELVALLFGVIIFSVTVNQILFKKNLLRK